MVSRGSVDEALKKHTSAKDLGRALNVRILLRGNVKRAGDAYNVTASIIDAEADHVLGNREFSWPIGKAVHGYSARVDRTVGSLSAVGLRQVELLRTKQKKSEDLDVRDLSYLAFDVWKNDKATYDIAMPLLRRALAQSPDDRLALMLTVRINLCECRNSWSANPQQEEAIGAEALERYLTKYRNDLPMTLQKAGLYELRGRYDDSLVLIDPLLEKSPEDPRLLVAKAINLFKLGRAKEALALMEEAIRQDPSGGWGSFAAEIRYALGHYAEASELARMVATGLSKAELAHPESGGIRLVQAAAEVNLGRMQQAKAALADFHASVPDVRTVSAIRKWLGPHATLAANEAFFDGLRRAGVAD